MAGLLLMGLLIAAFGKARAFDEDYKAKINGTVLHFRVRGTDKANPYLLILHGGPGFSAHMFYAWGASLEKTFTVVYLDQRGCGESERLNFPLPFVPTEKEASDFSIGMVEKIVTGWLAKSDTDDARDYTLANLIRDIEGVRAFLHTDRWYVLGHSWGGMLGLEYVAAHPHHVLGYIHMSGLISLPETQDAMLDNTEARFKATAENEQAGMRKEFAEKILQDVQRLRALPPNDPKRFFGGAGLAVGPAELYFARNQQTAYPALQKQAVEASAAYHVSPFALLPAWEPMAALIRNERLLTRDDHALLVRITVPTLIINGKQDGLTTAQAAQSVQHGIQGASLTLLEDCGHFPFAEQPEQTTQTILDFAKAQNRRTFRAIQAVGAQTLAATCLFVNNLSEREAGRPALLSGNRPVLAASRDSDILEKADTAMRRVPMYRVATILRDKRGVHVSRLDYVRPDRYHLTSVSPLMEMTVMGKATYIKAGGQWHKFPGDLNASINQMWPALSRDALKDAIVKKIGAETVQNTPATLYQVTYSAASKHGVSKYWISNRDNLILKMAGAGDTRFSLSPGKTLGGKFTYTADIDYKANVKIDRPNR